MLFVWDPAKAELNFAKHGISFEDAWEFDWAGAIVVDGRAVSTVSGVRRPSAFCMDVSVL
jgi:uncharacterized DUF497 family protein